MNTAGPSFTAYISVSTPASPFVSNSISRSNSPASFSATSDWFSSGIRKSLCATVIAVLVA